MLKNATFRKIVFNFSLEKTNPFGMTMIGRNGSIGAYRYGFNGMEKSDEVYIVSGASYTAEYWQYDSRLGRRWENDPITYPWQSSYAAFNNNPIYFSDPLGLEGEGEKNKKDNGFWKKKKKVGDKEVLTDEDADETELDEFVLKAPKMTLKEKVRAKVNRVKQEIANNNTERIRINNQDFKRNPYVFVATQEAVACHYGNYRGPSPFIQTLQTDFVTQQTSGGLFVADAYSQTIYTSRGGGTWENGDHVDAIGYSVGTGMPTANIGTAFYGNTYIPRSVLEEHDYSVTKVLQNAAFGEVYTVGYGIGSYTYVRLTDASGSAYYGSQTFWGIGVGLRFIKEGNKGDNANGLWGAGPTLKVEGPTIDSVDAMMDNNHIQYFQMKLENRKR